MILFLSDNGACYEWGPFGFDGVSRKGTTTLRTGAHLREIGGRGTHQSYGSAWSNLGNTPFRLYKHFTHEGGISTPFIAHWPNGVGQRDKWVRDPAHVMDVMPTLIEVTGAHYPAQLNGNDVTPLEGTSLLSAMRGEGLPERTIGFDHQAAHAIRQGNWKAVYSKRMPHKLQWELYNLADDRCEMDDLAKQQPERVKKMTADWAAWARRVGVIWERRKNPATSQARRARRGAAELTASPLIANRPLVIELTVEDKNPDGVAIAQGGNQHGYALHFIEGKPAFDVRVNRQVKRLVSEITASGRITLKATLDANSMTLIVNDSTVVSGPSPGLIPVQPIDDLSVGFDARTAAGNYEAPNRFSGKVIRHKVETQSNATAAAKHQPCRTQSR